MSEGVETLVGTPHRWLGVAAIHFDNPVVGLTKFEPLVSVHRWVILLDVDFKNCLSI